ncbi:MAG: putative lauroyl/myristoyl acyltransferase involved in biosynthesis [Verrucomicrobiaceae bacterium]|nr:putative lauroyl/myristoyl acyltransferase involved in biosynthesis [Verrucomicrobiaceae bacterium]
MTAIQRKKRAAAEWATQRERSSVFMLRLMTWISLRMGRPLARVVLHGIALYFYSFAPAARRASYAYLQRALGRKPNWRDCYKHFFTFAATIHDRVYLLNQRFDLFSITVHGEVELQAILKQGNGIFLLGAHFGSFEIVHALGQQQPGLRMALAMFEDNARKITAALEAINPAMRQEIIPLGHIDTMLQVQDRLSSGALIGMLADRSLQQDAALTLDFLGASAQFPLSSMRLAAVLRQRVFFMSGEYLGGNRYEIHFEPIADFSEIARGKREQAVALAVTEFSRRLEQHCRSEPYNWFNFFDFWKTARLASAVDQKPS